MAIEADEVVRREGIIVVVIGDEEEVVEGAEGGEEEINGFSKKDVTMTLRIGTQNEEYPGME